MNFNNFVNMFQNQMQGAYNPYENYDGFYDDFNDQGYNQNQYQQDQPQYGNNMFNRRADDDWSWDPDDEEALWTGGIYQNRPNRSNASPYAQTQQQQSQTNKSNQQPKKEEQKNYNKAKVEKMEIEKDATNTGQYYKNIGNQYYQKGLYQQAVENYTRAIEENDTESVFFSNRARCYKQLGDLHKACEDAKVAVELDDANIKAYLLWGQILAEIGKIEPGFDKLNRALSRIKKALDLCKSQGKKEFEKDLNTNMLRVRKVIWLKKEEMSKQKKIEGLNYIKGLISRDSTSGDMEKTQIFSEILDVVGDPLRHTVNEVPDDLCCKITMDLMQNPVITPSGVSYEKETLVNHFKNGGNFDPVTREPLRMDQINTNKAIKSAIEGYREANPWTFEQREGESFLDIKF